MRGEGAGGLEHAQTSDAAVIHAFVDTGLEVDRDHGMCTEKPVPCRFVRCLGDRGGGDLRAAWKWAMEKAVYRILLQICKPKMSSFSSGSIDSIDKAWI